MEDFTERSGQNYPFLLEFFTLSETHQEDHNYIALLDLFPCRRTTITPHCWTFSPCRRTTITPHCWTFSLCRRTTITPHCWTFSPCRRTTITPALMDIFILSEDYNYSGCWTFSPCRRTTITPHCWSFSPCRWTTITPHCWTFSHCRRQMSRTTILDPV